MVITRQKMRSFLFTLLTTLRTLQDQAATKELWKTFLGAVQYDTPAIQDLYYGQTPIYFYQYSSKLYLTEPGKRACNFYKTGFEHVK